MKKKHVYIFILVLFLTIGFAAVNTFITMSGSVALGTTNFEVKFNRAELNGANRTSLFNINKTAIRLSYSDISTTDESLLEYEVVNKSEQYDADVTITCSSALEDNTEFFYGEEKSPTPTPIRVEAGKFGKGKVNIKVHKSEESDTTENLGTLYNLVKNQSQGLDTLENGVNYNRFTNAYTEKGVFETKDTDSGKSVYFYRGDVNNNVLFAGRCWNIVRTTETNGVKLIFTGNPVGGTCLPFGTQMGFSLVPKTKWTNELKDNTYVGYMTGAGGSQSYEEAHTNKYDSQAKEMVDEWYEKNLKDTKYESYLEDTTFCNDRSLATNYDNIRKDKEEGDAIETNLGYGSNKTYYAAAERASELTIDVSPTLKCANPNDRFSVNEDKGNGDLKYPIALITADELVYAGVSILDLEEIKDEKIPQKKSYLFYQNGVSYWTMTPFTYESSRTVLYYTSDTQNIQSWKNNEEKFVIPVISLNSDIIVLKGEGTMTSPYILETEDTNENSYICTITAEPVGRTSYNEFDLDQLKTGDEYCFGDECFYVVSNENNIIKMLAKYNIYVGDTYYDNGSSQKNKIEKSDPLYGKQNKKAVGYPITGEYPFIGVTPYSFTSNKYDESIAKKYVDEYVSYLIKTSKIKKIKGGLITVEDLENLGCDKSKKTCNSSWYDWVAGLTYWVGSPDPNDDTKTYLVGADGFFGSSVHNNLNNRGIRPMITLNIEKEEVEKDEKTTFLKLVDFIKSKSLGLDTAANINYDAISSPTNGTGIYETKNTDSGKSVYFYRGQVNNNLKFADTCWKILRTTEEGGVKLVYNGAVKNGGCDNTSDDVVIGSSPYAEDMSDNAYIGYMYGNINAKSYEEAHANINDSTIKKVVDQWYEQNLKDTEYEKYLEDTVYCNDRSIATPGVNNTLASKYGTLGYGTNPTGYGAVSRIANAATLTNPSYKCAQKNDRFTVNNEVGNKALKYPIGLLTSDEAAYAGATRFRNSEQYRNTKYFLYNGEKTYTMSPNWYDGRIAVGAYNADVDEKKGYFGIELANLEARVRPVISLKNDLYLLGGDGSVYNPYYVGELSELTEDDIPYFWQDNGIFENYYLDAYKKINEMTLEEKIGQLIIAHHSSSANDAITNYNVSGFTYFEPDFLGKSEMEVKNMISSEQSKSKTPLITAVDEEGGRVVRVSSNTNLISNELSKYPNLFYTNVNNKNAWKLSSDLYKEGGYPLIEQETKIKSAALNRLGLNVNFAPVVDMAIEGAYISDRVIGLDAKGTAKYASTVINASKGTNVSYTLKHFPGYGNNSDTHTSGSVDNKSLEELMANDIVPFVEGIDAGAEAVLISHNTVASVDEDNPSSLSRPIHNLLNYDLDFTGVIITDALDMGATKDIPKKFVKAIQAENNLLLVQDYKSAINEIKAAVTSGEISENKINRLAFKVLAWKYYKGLM